MPQNKRKTMAVLFRVPPEDLKILERGAAADDRSLTDFCRVSALRAARQLLEEQQAKPPTKSK
jgi:uncharacterized protein (DUF1778 family)